MKLQKQKAMTGIEAVDAKRKTGAGTGKYTSAMQKYGMEASESRQAEFEAARGQAALTYGAGGGEGGSGSAVIVVKLGAGLQAQIEETAGVAIEIQQGAGY